MTIERQSPWRSMVLIADSHGVTPRTLVVVVIGWIVAAAAARVGLPPIDRGSELTSRPLETFGTLAVCIPASLHAALLGDGLPWLGAVSPRSLKGLRFVWIGTTATCACLPALIWAWTLDPRVPRVHALFVWILVYSCAVLSVAVIRVDLAAVLPLVVTVVFTTPRLVPFEDNVLYNDRMTGRLIVVAVVSLVIGGLIYTAAGDRRGRPVA